MSRESQLPAAVAAILEQHLRLDQALDGALNGVVDDTEASALAIIHEVRKLHDTSTKLINYLEGSSLKSGELGAEILDSTARLVHIGAFMDKLPAKMERDMKGVQSIVSEIRQLGDLADMVQQISMQSHMLAINAAIEAMHAGDAGAAFRVVADEMRTLASNSRAAAVRINQGLSRARKVVEEGMAQSIAESTEQLGAVSHAAASIQKMHDNLEDMSHYYKTRFTVVTEHNEDLRRDIATVLGQIQYQDVVRQAIERVRGAMEKRNASLENAVATVGRGGPAMAQLPQQLELILTEYLTEEDKHRHSARVSVEEGAGAKIELF